MPPMSRRWFTRLLIASAPLFGAVPLLGQGTPVVSAASAVTFPFGRFVPQTPGATAIDSTGLVIDFRRDGVIQMYQGGRPTVMYMMGVAGEVWEISQFEGGCEGIGGRYTWIYEGGVLRFELIEDACSGRIGEVTGIRLVNLP
jgi:hypothetical protein